MPGTSGGVLSGRAVLSFVPEFNGVQQAARQQGDRAGRGFSDSFDSTSKKKMGSTFKSMTGLAAGAFAGKQAFNFFGDLVDEGREAEKVTRITVNAIRQTKGAANISAGAVGDLAEALSNKAGIDDEVIQTGANLLLTFKKVRNEAGAGNNIFDRSAAAATDLSVQFGSVESASKMLGKALNDPLKGISALSRAGVTFTAQQKDQIAWLVRSGDVLSAQKIILGEVESQVGGAAAAAADPMQKLGVVVGNLKERLGVALLPTIATGANLFGRALPRALDLTGSGFGWLRRQGEPVIRVLTGVVAQGRWLFELFRTGRGDAEGFGRILDNIFGGTGRLVGPFEQLYDVGSTVVSFVRDNLTSVLVGLGAALAYLIGPTVWAGISALGSAFLTAGSALASPVVLIAALAAGVVLAYQRIEPFRDLVDRVAGSLRDGLGVAISWIAGTALPWLRQGWSDLTAAFSAGEGDGIFGSAGEKARAFVGWVVGDAVPAVRGAFDDLVAGFRDGGAGGVFGPIGAQARGVFDWITGTALPGIQSAFGSFLAGIRGDGGEGSLFTDLGEGIISLRNGAVVVVRWLGDHLLPVIQAVVGFVRDHAKPILIGLGITFAAIASPVATAVAAFVFAYQKFSWFREGIASVVGFVKGYFERFWLPTFVFAWRTVSTYIGYVRGYIDTLRPWISGVLGVIRTYFTSIWLPVFQRAWGVVQTFVGLVRGYINNALLPTFRAIWPVLMTVANGIRQAWGIVADGLTWLWTTAVFPVFNAVVGFIGTQVIPRFLAFKDSALAVFGAWRSAVSTAWGIVQPIFSAVVGFVRDQLEWRFNAFLGVVQWVWGGVQGAISSAWDFIKPKFDAIVSFVRDTLVPVWDRIAGAVGSAFDRIPGIIGGALRRAGDIVAGFLRGAGGIADAIGLGGPIGGPLKGAAERADRWGETSDTGHAAVHAMARGGHIKPGWGTPGKDSVPIMGMPGEVMQSVPAVRKWGLRAMLDLNARRVPRGWRIPGFAEGGLIDRVGDAARGIAGGSLERAWPAMNVGSGLTDLIPGGINFLRTKVLEKIKGEAGKLQAGSFLSSVGRAPGTALDWVRQAMALTGVPETWFGPLVKRMMQESGGNPRAINLWDSNAAKGQPSKGLFQTIDSTFNAFKLPGLGNIWNGVHNAVAAIRYMISRYGSVFNLPSGGYATGGEVTRARSVQPITMHRRPFDMGGVVRPGVNVIDNKTGKDEVLANVTNGAHHRAGLTVEGNLVVQDATDIDLIVQKQNAAVVMGRA